MEIPMQLASGIYMDPKSTIASNNSLKGNDLTYFWGSSTAITPQSVRYSLLSRSQLFVKRLASALALQVPGTWDVLLSWRLVQVQVISGEEPVKTVQSNLQGLGYTGIVGCQWRRAGSLLEHT